MIIDLFKSNRYLGHRTFTYYIPSPPTRATGYQEKEIDGLTQKIASLGFDIIDIKTQSDTSGMWFILHLGAKTPDALAHPLAFNIHNGNIVEEEKIERIQDIVHDEI